MKGHIDMTKIYLASCYSHKNASVRELRFNLINVKAAELMRQGHIVFSPISHSHPIAVQEDLPLSFEFWQAMNESFIKWCDVVYVYCMDGWQHSQGIKSEIAYANKINKPINYID